VLLPRHGTIMYLNLNCLF